MIKYSIIISTYNWGSALELILQNLLPQLQLHCDTEVIIADDGSTKDTAELILQFKHQLPNQVVHVWHEDIGFRRTLILNKAALVARGEYLMFLDGDCIPFADYITNHKNLAETGFFVAGNRVLLSKDYTKNILQNPHLLKQLFACGIFGWISAKFTKKVNKFLGFLRISPKSKWRYTRASSWKYPKGCNIGIWANDFRAVNGYDQDFVGWGYEDSDLFIRLLHLGTKIKDGRFAIPVLHLWHKESDRSNSNSNYQRLMESLGNINHIKVVNGMQDLSKTCNY